MCEEVIYLYDTKYVFFFKLQIFVCKKRVSRVSGNTVIFLGLNMNINSSKRNKINKVQTLLTT